MINLERKRSRYLKDPLAVRLAGLASSLARIVSSSRRPDATASVAEMLEECQYYIEWTAAEAPPEIAAELVDMQVMLAMWRNSLNDAWHSQTLRSLLSLQAKKWSDQALAYSGILNQ